MSDTNAAEAESLADKNDETELLNIRIPTQTKKSQKRKHIRTDFTAHDLDASVQEAQRLEKERLGRLEKIKPANDHIQQMESLFLAGSSGALPQLDISNQDFDFDSILAIDDNDGQKRFKQEDAEVKPQLFPNGPSTSKGPVALVDLTEDSDDDCMITDVRSTYVPRAYSDSGKRMRWAQAEKDKLDADQMEQQHSMEAQRLKKARSAKDLESTEKCGGRLLVNAGHPADDPDIFVIAHLTHVLQPHQLGGIRFMYDNTIESINEYKKSPGFGCILAHSMGLGKTIQVITFSEIFLRATKAKKIMIIVPVNTIQNWYSEYDKWIPRMSDCGDRIRNFEVFLLGDTVKTFDQRVNMIDQWNEKGGVLLIGYDMFRTLIKTTKSKKEKRGRPKLNLSGVSSNVFKDAFDEAKKEEEAEFELGFTNGGRVVQEAHDLIRRALLDPGPDLVVCDEGHKIKNINADISMALGSINTKRRIVLTGYPLQNNLLEYFCMIDFVRPRYLGTRKSFVERFEKPIKNGQCVDSTGADVKMAMQRTHVLVELVKGFVQRRTHHLLKKILPESREFVLLLRKSQIQRHLYRNFVLYAKKEITNGATESTFNPLTAFSACSKIWNHPDILFRLVGGIRRNEMLNEEKKRRNAEMQQQQQQMMNGMVQAYGSPFLQHHQNGVMMNGSWHNGYHQPSPYQGSSNPPTPSTSLSAISTPTTGKKKGKRVTKKSKSDEDEEEVEKEPKLRYDWSYDPFDQYQEGVIENGYKLLIALEILDETTKIDEKILIFSQNLSALDLIEEMLAKRAVVGRNGKGARWEKNRNYLRLDGQTNGTDREKLIRRFNSEPGLHLFLISTKAGSLGINLVSANRCIIFDACWNPCHDAQAVCRVYRYGQQKKTFVYRLIMDNSMERSIFNRQISKHGLQQRVVDDAQVDANISQKELETLLMYDESKDVKTDAWNTADWQFEDEVLDSVTHRMSQIFSQKPFLHESLIMESEKSLSEEEKREAQLLFEQEKRDEMRDPLAGFSPSLSQSSSLPRLGAPSMFNNYQWVTQPPLQPHHPSQSPFAPPPGRPTPMPHTLRMNIGQFHHQPGGHTMTSFNNGGGFINNNNPMHQQQMLPPRDPTAFNGAMSSRPPRYTPAGVLQWFITDRAYCFPIVGRPNQLHAVPLQTEVQFIVQKSGTFVRLSDGTLLDSSGSILDEQARILRANEEEHATKKTIVINLD